MEKTASSLYITLIWKSSCATVHRRSISAHVLLSLSTGTHQLRHHTKLWRHCQNLRGLHLILSVNPLSIQCSLSVHVKTGAILCECHWDVMVASKFRYLPDGLRCNDRIWWLYVWKGNPVLWTEIFIVFKALFVVHITISPDSLFLVLSSSLNNFFNGRTLASYLKSCSSAIIASVLFCMNKKYTRREGHPLDVKIKCEKTHDILLFIKIVANLLKKKNKPSAASNKTDKAFSHRLEIKPHDQ